MSARRRVSRLVLAPGKERSLLRRHPWIYSAAIAGIDGRVEPGEVVEVVADDRRFLGWAVLSPASAIRARVWSFDAARLPDERLVAERVAAAVARRAPLAARSDALRLVFGEADLLPGLVVDRYAGQLVVQIGSTGAERWREAIVDALVEHTGLASVYERSDAVARRREGLAPREGALRGPAPAAPLEIVEDGVRYRVDVLAGHKTGFYIDQRDNRALVARQARGRTLLNCFCYTGGFTIAARCAGAAGALSIDSSEPALAQARENERANGLAPGEWRAADVFASLAALLAEGRRFGAIVLDPPKFAPTTQHVARAARAYKEINLKALQLLEPGGLLFTFSCSAAITADLFQKIVAGAVFDAGVDAQMLARLHAGEDHPMLMTHPDGEYLKGLMLRRI